MFRLPSPLHKIENELTEEFRVQLYLKRDDLIHPDISGNKWRKLKYNIAQVQQQQKDTILTFGGAYSNHITATAAAGRHFGYKTIGIIRGEEHTPLNESLRFAQDHGMQLVYADRTLYREKALEVILRDTPYMHDIEQYYILPEGGANEYALSGCREITEEIEIDFDYIYCACGTGTTIAGIAQGLKKHQQAVGISVLKGVDFLTNELIRQQDKHVLHQLAFDTNYHFGGYAKTTPELLDFIQHFYSQHHIMLDYVYTGKMMYAVLDNIQRGKFAKGTTIVAVHTGGVANANVFNLP